jgi:putative ABC transport system ATP-binding protein
MSAVRVEHVYKEYRLGSQTVHALQDISMVVAPGRFLAIAGPSGSGKTTLLNMIGCIDTPSKGDIFIGEEMVSRKTPDELAALRARTLGFVFQTFNLLPVLDAWENVEYPMLQRSDLTKKERQERVRHYLDVVGLANRMRQRPNELSGGQRQRVAIARALAGGPSIILADEPTANLDSKTGESILALMKHINETEKTTFIFSTHDFRIMEMADRVVSVADGRLVV